MASNTRIIFWQSVVITHALTILSVLLALTLIPTSAFAYYELDPVQITLSASSVTVKANATVSISCKLNPESEKQLPGCGMEECPQTCGEGCLNDDGWCTCAGTSYQTMHTSVTLHSSDSTIATASYANGVISVKGHSEGNATITVTATLAKHTDASEVFSVTVSEAASAANTDTSTTNTNTSTANTSTSTANTSTDTANTSNKSKGSSNMKTSVQSTNKKSSKTKKGVSAQNTQGASASGVTSSVKGSTSEGVSVSNVASRVKGSTSEGTSNTVAGQGTKGLEDHGLAQDVGASVYTAGIDTLGVAAEKTLSQFDLTSEEALQQAAKRPALVMPVFVASAVLAFVLAVGVRTNRRLTHVHETRKRAFK